MTVLVTLFVLWKLDIIFLNVPALTQSEMKEQHEDKLSNLLGLEYPRIGDDLQIAYNLYPDVAFESRDQIDFQIGEHDTLYVHFKKEQDRDLIDHLQLYESGNLDQIRRLGEKMLPEGSVFISENYTQAEDRNETFRYTKLEHENQYFYEYGEEQYAVITISYDESDLIPEKEPIESLTKTLEVTFLKELPVDSVGDPVEFTHLQEEEAREQVELVNEGSSHESGFEIAEEDFDNMQLEFVGTDEESNELEAGMDGLNQGSFSLVSIQVNNERLKDPEFLSYAAQGEIKGIDVPLGAANGPYRESVIGQPDWVSGAEGGFTLMYESYHAGFGIGYDYQEFPEMPFVAIYLPIELSYDEMIRYLGKPREDGISELSGDRYLFYQLGDYTLWAESSETSEIFTFIELGFSD